MQSSWKHVTTPGTAIRELLAEHAQAANAERLPGWKPTPWTCSNHLACSLFSTSLFLEGCPPQEPTAWSLWNQMRILHLWEWGSQGMPGDSSHTWSMSTLWMIAASRLIFLLTCWRVSLFIFHLGLMTCVTYSFTTYLWTSCRRSWLKRSKPHGGFCSFKAKAVREGRESPQVLAAPEGIKEVQEGSTPSAHTHLKLQPPQL